MLIVLIGGKVEGMRREMEGCRDNTPPIASQEYRILHRLYFARQSPLWTGGVAFIDKTCEKSEKSGDDHPGTVMRIHLVTEGEMALLGIGF